MMKIITIVGARPQFIKAATVSRIVANHDNIKEIIVHTGQHFDKNMSNIFFDEMEIPEPDYNLGVNSLSHGAMTGQMLLGIEKIIIKEKPDCVLVYGDTNSTIAGALAAKKLEVKVAHVEAGLRSYNMSMPEEINRILTDRISDILFCPTDTAIGNLAKEGFKNFPCCIVNSGDVMLDASKYYAEKAVLKSKIIETYKLNDFILCTIHRAENTNDVNNLRSIIDAFNKISKEIKIIMPLHPRTKEMLLRNKLKFDFDVIDPVGYFDMLELLKHCRLVMTDSGGLQKEAFYFKKHCVILRSETEWTELVEHGFNMIAGINDQKVYDSFKEMVERKSDFEVDLYGKGAAGQVIVTELLSLVS